MHFFLILPKNFPTVVNDKRTLKNKMKKIILAISLLTLPVTSARADIFGGDVAILMQLLSNAINQLQQLVAVVKTGQDTIDLMKDVNNGVNDILQFQAPSHLSLPHHERPEWASERSSIEGLHRTFGKAIMSPVQGFQDNVDASIAKAMHVQSLVSTYAARTDQIAREIQNHSKTVSPKGAQKLNAQASGVMVGVLNENLRVQTESVRLQAEDLALKNHEDKKRVEFAVENQKKLSIAMRTGRVNFETPRF